MRETDFDRIDAVFRAARQRRPDEREAFLDEACVGDPALRSTIAAMLAADEDDHALLDRPVAHLASLPGAETTKPPEIAGYTVIEEIGRGGMGVVYRAEQAVPRRVVAIKVISPWLVSVSALDRFRREASVLARLDHPGIAHVYDAHLTTAQPYIAMELVSGATITQFVDERQSDRRAIARLLADVADAVSHAHERQIVHRDLKPGNVMVTAAGQVKVLDFGAARLVEHDGTRSLQTEIGQLIGTLPYMSPEQFEPNQSVGPATDVYALGVVGYRLLTGRLPFDIADRPLAEAARIVRETEPSSISSHDRRLRGDLATIIGKALEKEPARRYPNAAALRDDLKRFLDANPIAARPPSRWYQFQKFTHRNRAIVMGTAATMLVLIAGIIATSIFLVRARHEARRADAARSDAEWSAVVSNLSAAEAHIRSGTPGVARRHLQTVPADARGWEWRHLVDRLDDSVSVLLRSDEALRGLAAGPRGERLLVTGIDGFVRVIDPLAGAAPIALDGNFGTLDAAAIDPSGRWAVSAGFDSVQVHDLEIGETIHATRAPSYGAYEAVFSEGGSAFVLATLTGRVEIRHTRSGAVLETIELGPNGAIRLGRPADGILPVAHMRGELAFIDLARREVVHRAALGFDGVTIIRNQDDPYDVLIGTFDGRLVRWRRDEGVIFDHELHETSIVGIAFLDDATIASVGVTDHLLVSDLESGSIRARFDGHEDIVIDLVRMRDGMLATASRDCTVRRWDTNAPPNPLVVEHPRSVQRVAFHPTLPIIATGGGRNVGVDGRVRLFDVPTGALIHEFAAVVGEAYGLAFTADGKTLVAGGAFGGSRLVAWDLPSRALLYDHVTTGVMSLALNGGGRAAAGFVDGSLRVFDSRTGEIIAEHALDLGEIRSIVWEGAANLLVGGRDGIATLDLTDGTLEAIALPRMQVQCVVPDPTVERVLIAGFESELLLLIRATNEMTSIETAPTEVSQAAWSPDGTRLVTVGKDGLVRLRHGDSAIPIVDLVGHRGTLRTVAFSPDGKTLATGGEDLRLWTLGESRGRR